MISLFLKPPNSFKKNIVFPRMSYIRDRFAVNLNKVKAYYVSARKAVPNNHPLVTMITSMLVPATEFGSFSDITQWTGYNVGSALKMNSMAFRHGWQPASWFYGTAIREYIYIRETELKEFPANWQNLEPVVVNYHPRSDISFVALDGTTMTPEIGYAVITIDPVALLYQFKKWWSTQLLLPPERRLRTTHFVAMYVLPGMIRSHLNVAFINRMCKQLKGELPEEPLKRNLTALPDTVTFVDETARNVIETLIAESTNFRDTIQLIPIPYGKSMMDVTSIHSEPSTLAMKTYRALRSLPYMELLAALDLQTKRNGNSDQFSEWLGAMKRAKNEDVFRGLGSMTKTLYTRFEENIAAYIP